MRRCTAVTALAALSLAVLTACGGSSSGSSSATASGSAGSTTTKVGITVAGEAGRKPTLTIPKTTPPSTTSIEVLTPGEGAVVHKGDVLVADYLGQTWADKDGKPNVFDNSYDRGRPAGFPIGVGSVVKGWDSTLVGQKLGSRVLLSVTPADGYGAQASADNALGGQTLVFVVDLRSTITGDGVARGTVATLPAGYPQLRSESGKRPEVTGVAGVKPGGTSRSALLVKGSGEPITEDKQLVLQYLQTDVKTGQQTQRTWDRQQPQVVPAEQVLGLVTALKGQPVGSRAVVVTAEPQGSPAQILVVDVIGQF